MKKHRMKRLSPQVRTIARLSAQLTKAQAAIDAEKQYHLSQTRLLADAVHMTRRVLGSGFVGLQPEMIAQRHSSDRVEMPMYSPAYSPRVGGDMTYDNAVAAAVLRTMSLVSTCDEDVQRQGRRWVHLRVRLADGQVGYALSEEVLYDSDPEWLAERLAQEMAPMLVRELRARKS